MHRSTLALCALATLAACAPAPSQILVVVDSDLQAPSELASVQIVASSDGRTETHDFDLTGGAITLPFSFGLSARESDPDPRSVRLFVSGVGPGGETIITWVIATTFRRGRTVRVDAALARACTIEMFCEAGGLVCDRGVCREEAIDGALLPEVDPASAPPSLFEGPSDPHDGGADASGCVDGVPCETGSLCVPGTLRCSDGTCAPAARSPAGEPCGDGRVCDAEGRCLADDAR